MQLPPGWELPDSIRVRLGDSAGKQRAMIEEEHLLLILHKTPAPGATTAREAAFFWRDPDGDWKASNGKAGLGALKNHLAEYERAVDELDTQLDKAQDAAALFRVLEAAVPLHRAAKNQHAALQAAREALPTVREIIVLRDAASEIDRHSELLEIDARNAVDYRIARQGEEQNRLSLEMTRAGHRLNFLAALFLPLTAVASVFGMNLPSGLEQSPTWLFWSVLGFGLLLGFILRGLFFKTEK
jgi:Mg2+ and Co2+ transporter CorA